MRFGRPLGALITVGLILVGCLGKTTDSPAPIDILSPGKWTSLAPMPTARAPVRVPRGGPGMAPLGNRLHAVGGSADRATGAHETYDPASDRWTDAPPMPTARDHLAAVVFEGRLWAIGGRTSFVGTQYETVEIYDPARAARCTRPPLPARPRRAPP